MNKKNSTQKKFKIRKISGPHKLLKAIFVNFKNRNLYKSPKFWFVTTAYIFFVIKAIQYTIYVNQFTVAIPKEEALNSLAYIDNNILRKMNPQVLHDYLDKMEKEKEKRKIQKQISNNNTIHNNSNEKLI
jgi:hypothetical protein